MTNPSFREISVVLKSICNKFHWAVNVHHVGGGKWFISNVSVDGRNFNSLLATSHWGVQVQEFLNSTGEDFFDLRDVIYW